MEYFITSRYGKIESLKIFRYDFNKTMSAESKSKLTKWLSKSDQVLLYELTDTYFIVFHQMDFSFQYDFKWAKYLEAPYNNTQRVSSFISYQIITSLKDNYHQYHYYNSLVTDNQIFGDFMVYKCIKFNVEVFKSGRFYVHLLPHSKIVNSKTVSENYIKSIISKISSNIAEVFITLRIKQKRYKQTADLSNKDDITELLKFIDKNRGDDLFVTFNYRTLSQIDPKEFISIQRYTQNIINNEISILEETARSIRLDFCKLYEKPFFKFTSKSPDDYKNLIVGGGSLVKKQSAAFHSGIYKAVNNVDICPIYINSSGEIVESEFYEKLKRYNCNGENNSLVSPVCIKVSSIDKDFILPNSIQKTVGKKTINAVFSQHQIPDDFFDKMYDDNHIFQVYVGMPQKYKLDNFTVKCLVKAGGVLNILNSTYENENTYFIGIDLGHGKDFSIIGLTLFSNKGILLDYRTSICYKNEALETHSLKTILSLFKRYIADNKLPEAKKIIVHRDGKVHKLDIDRILDSLILIFDVIIVDIVEIIKTGYPVIGCYDGQYALPESGEYFVDRDEDYAILITNTQTKNKKINQILNPLIIKRKYGSTKFSNIVEQVYWFTKVYTNNLYSSSRLPATTEKANNIVGTGLKNYQSSYLG